VSVSSDGVLPAAHATSPDTCSAFARGISVKTPRSLVCAACATHAAHVGFRGVGNPFFVSRLESCEASVAWPARPCFDVPAGNVR
jgi:hypothetical protein